MIEQHLPAMLDHQTALVRKSVKAHSILGEEVIRPSLVSLMSISLLCSLSEYKCLGKTKHPLFPSCNVLRQDDPNKPLFLKKGLVSFAGDPIDRRR